MIEPGVEHTGIVAEWYPDLGWGVIVVESLPVWAHFSHIDAPPGTFRTLEAADRVRIRVEAAEQDGYHWRATWIGEEPERWS